METVKKKMATLKNQLEEAEDKATKAERELAEANDRADNVSSFCFLLRYFAIV